MGNDGKNGVGMNIGTFQKDNLLDRRTWVEGPPHLGQSRVAVEPADAERVAQAWSNLDQQLRGFEATDALLEALTGQVSQRTLYALQAQLTPKMTSLLSKQARQGQARVILTFAGQAQSYFDDLERLYELPNPRRIILAGAEALQKEVEETAGLQGLHPFGFNLKRWIETPDTRPSAARLSDAVISQPLIFVTQIAQLVALERLGFHLERISEWAVATTGHSQGILPALVAAEAHSLDSLTTRAAQICRYLVWQGIYMQTSYGRPAGVDTPMVAVTGQSRSEVQAALTGLKAVIGLANAPRRFVISGQPASLEQAVARLQKRSKAEFSAFEKGLRERPHALGIEWLAVSAPYHSPAMADALPKMQARAEQFGLQPAPSVLKCPCSGSRQALFGRAKTYANLNRFTQSNGLRP